MKEYSQELVVQAQRDFVVSGGTLHHPGQLIEQPHLALNRQEQSMEADPS